MRRTLEEANGYKRLVYLFIAGIFTVAADAWYSIAYEVRPFR